MLRDRARRVADRSAARLERAVPTERTGPRSTSEPLAVVLLAWDPVASRQCAHRLTARLDRIAPRARRVLVDNRGEGMEWAGTEGFESVRGDNSSWEFSGLQVGVDLVRREGSPAAWILANDRYIANDDSVLDHVDGATIDAVIATNALAGRINRYPSPSRAFGLEISSWACSSFLVVAGVALRSLGSLGVVGEEELAEVIGPVRGEAPLLRSGGPLDEREATYLTEWLTGEGADLAERWYRHRPVTEESWEELAGKVRSILNEQLLSARARDAGIPVLPLPLACSLGRMDPASAMYRCVVGTMRRRPLATTRWLRGRVGRNLFALDAWIEHRRRPTSTAGTADM